MSWMKRLYDVYENNSDVVGEFESRGEGQRFTLLPVSHVTQSAQIEVLLDREGNFFKARVVSKDEARTILPATLDSANRAGSKVAAYFLHDKLFYVAGDYLKYGGEEKRSANFPQYIDQMKGWATSEFTHRKVEHIYNYVKKGTVIEDLIAEKILFVDGNGKLVEKWTKQDDKKYGIEKPEIYKVVTGDSSEALVRFTILSETSNDPVVWEDKELFKAFQQYLANKMDKEAEVGLCYVTGQTIPLTERHGSRLRNAGDMSKLISSNDNTGFTYRGRFDKPNQAVQIGYDISQKAHSAMRWLIQRQGYRSDTRNFITFGVENPAVVQPFKGTLDIYNDPMGLMTGIGMVENEKEYTNLVIAEQVQQAFKGKKHNFEIEGIDHIIVMAVDAATTGRLAIVYYQELDSRLFLDRLSHWHDTCKWHQSYYDAVNKKTVSYVGTPSTYHIVESVYGERADEKVKKELYTRLLPCIVDRAVIPKDIVMTIFSRVKNPMGFNKDLSNPTGEWQRTLNIACALIKKQYEKEEIDMALDLENQSRDYLFGRLLGVAEVFETNELKRKNDPRATNAMRYFNAFTQHPARVWMTIQKQLHPYKIRPSKFSQRYINLFQEIEDNIKFNDMNNNALGPQFLLGYSSQIRSLYTKQEQKEENENGTN
ncbi:type I-C CRISPR-associated protein Cas8c/Csd1 [Sporosarcina limicola]|uniref:CRISPR-associated protein Csd1 n=1 Tax=Sporosarcina limicola TaxID=34101 RepID=A0A927ME30_9BACL|nr:type I-C CRISPR-associated protein Cas8c/Csd1 [Sporosarcina limicola]MBE1553054.1 CRISPR-associated protein Csd1 [Sporosarcina limicola]